MRRFLLLIVIILSIRENYTWQFYHLGRRRNGGNLGLISGLLRIKNVHGVKEEYFTQKLDHFVPTDTRTWQQRYFTNDEYYNGKNIAFLFIGGEGEATVGFMVDGTWIKYAKEFGAFLFLLEHRFYGKSRPTKDLSVENLKYLSTEQALSDLATFIPAMNTKYNFSDNVQWIVFGGSYSGALAAWLRLKYPHLVQGAVSVSGPLQAQADFKDFLRSVSESLEDYDTKCPNQIKHAIEQTETLMESELGRRELSAAFNVCTPFGPKSDRNDIANFYEIISADIASIVQYDRIDYLLGIGDICATMNHPVHKEPFQNLAEIISLVLMAYKENCMDYRYDKMIEDLRNTSWDSPVSEGARQWMYQTCTEFGFYQTSSHAPHIFGNKFPLSFFIQQCQDVFGKNFNSTLLHDVVERTNTNYGGLDIKASNIVLVQGSIDPWHVLGFPLHSLEGLTSIYIIGTAHCAFLYPPKMSDPDDLLGARKKVGQLINYWLRFPAHAVHVSTRTRNT